MPLHSIFALRKQYVHVLVSKYKYCTHRLLPRCQCFSLNGEFPPFLPPDTPHPRPHSSTRRAPGVRRAPCRPEVNSPCNEPSAITPSVAAVPGRNPALGVAEQAKDVGQGHTGPGHSRESVGSFCCYTCPPFFFRSHLQENTGSHVGVKHGQAASRTWVSTHGTHEEFPGLLLLRSPSWGRSPSLLSSGFLSTHNSIFPEPRPAVLASTAHSKALPIPAEPQGLSRGFPGTSLSSGTRT